jgi:hypothetical protein
MSDFELMKRVEAAQRAVYHRAHSGQTTQRLAGVGQEAVAEVSGALDAEIRRLRIELDRARRDLSTKSAGGAPPATPEGVSRPARRDNRPRRAR